MMPSTGQGSPTGPGLDFLAIGAVPIRPDPEDHVSPLLGDGEVPQQRVERHAEDPGGPRLVGGGAPQDRLHREAAGPHDGLAAAPARGDPEERRVGKRWGYKV